MGAYRLYFLDAEGGIQARQDFAAEDDGEARIISDALRHACAECYEDYELWQAKRCLGRGDGDGQMIDAAKPIDGDARLQARVLELEELLLGSHWRVARSEYLLAATATLRRSLDGKATATLTHEEMIRYICAKTGPTMMSLQLAEGTRLTLRGSRGFDRFFDEFFAVVETDDCACGVAFQNARQIVVPAIDSSPIYAAHESLDVLRAQGVASCVSTPFFASDGGIAGMFSILRRTVWHPADGELAQLRQIAADIAAALADPFSAAARLMRAAA